MSDRLTGKTGASLIGGTKARSPQALLRLLIPIAVVGAALALAPLWLGDSRVLMGVAVLGLAFEDVAAPGEAEGLRSARLRRCPCLRQEPGLGTVGARG